ncbi:hypothetical protein [Raoultibacter massiliensis]|uniref:hypothetical protein n=1 Tax=Raoultibacter massiliensis TaxID=1852371 RepID=UPI003A9081E9
MYEHLPQDHKVFFEGLEESVFYRWFYLTGEKSSRMWDLFCYGRGLKIDKDPGGSVFDEHRDEYDSDLRDMLSAVALDFGGAKRGRDDRSRKQEEASQQDNGGS